METSPVTSSHLRMPPPVKATRATSEQSDITMNESDFSLPMEYSDTSDDYFRGEEGLLRPELGRHRTGSSTFRLRGDSFNKSSRVVRFDTSPKSGHLFYEEDFGDDEHELDSEDEGKYASASRSFTSNVWHVVSSMAKAVDRSPNISRANRKREESDGDTLEYPHHVSLGNSRPLLGQTTEDTPLLAETPAQRSAIDVDERRSNHWHESIKALLRGDRENSERVFRLKVEEEKAITISTAFLIDYENGRPPSLPQEVELVTNFQLALRQVKYSLGWKVLLQLGCFAFFISSCFEGTGTQGNFRVASLLNFFAIVVLLLDLLMTNRLRKHSHPTSSSLKSGGRHGPSSNLFDSKGNSSRDSALQVRQSRAVKWARPLALFLFVQSIETTLCSFGLLNGKDKIAIWSSLFKPIALFYVSTRARDALEALKLIAPIVLRVLAMELFLILCFAAVACRLYSTFESFQDLSSSFLSLFELSTTVVNPSAWMPIYEESRTNAFFFTFFIVTSVFYLHSLVLSVVFQTYIQAASEIHDRSTADREDALRLSFLALQSIGSNASDDNEIQSDRFVDIQNVRKTLILLRPHYNSMKINALVQIVDPADQRYIDFSSFRTKMRQALNASIRSTRTTSTYSNFLELVAALVAISNFFYVILLTSSFQADWFDLIEFETGLIITFLGAFELIARVNPCKSFSNLTPLTRLNGAFDGLAALAALISIKGIILRLSGLGSGEFLLMGRAIDMIRIMRFFKIFRDIVKRSSEVLPALLGPFMLVIGTIHIFTYMGMAFWGGAVHVGKAVGRIEPLYDLNNFNSYLSGVVTMFQVLVVNDWHAIAAVFLYADRFSSPYIVYPFFVGGNLLCVSIMLNVLTAFFVGSFVTKLTDQSEDHLDSTAVVPKTRGFDIKSSAKAIKRVSSERNVRFLADDNSTISSVPELKEFDVFEREGFDKIMRTVAGGPEDEDFAKQVCDYLEVFESLSPGRQKVGYMTCCQKTMNRYGNRRFQTIAKGFVDDDVLHAVVSDMHAELLALSSRRQDYRSLHRVFPHTADAAKKLEISASLLRDHPAASLFVSRVIEEK